MMIRPARISDAGEIAAIYNHYIRTDTCTFEEEAVTIKEMEDRICHIQSMYPYLVFEKEGKVLAYAYAGQWKTRSAYRFTVELSVYVDHSERGAGLGIQVYQALIERLKGTSYKRLIGGIALPNDKSVLLHERLGFRHTGTLEKVGIKFGKWIDVAYYQLDL